MTAISRRDFCRTSTVLLALSGLKTTSPTLALAATTQNKSNGFFTTRQSGGRWWLATPEGKRFFSLGLNHIDPASLRYGKNVRIWRDKYGNSMERWLKESVRPNLLDWGFNSVGWVQEVVTREKGNHRHSRNFTFEEYQWLDMPYCHMLPFSEIHQWEVETRLPDIRGKGFAEWCDVVAREHCARYADDPKLIGYFYSDCPVWVHHREGNAWRGSLFDPDRLSSEAGRRELFELATKYYQVTHDAIRRYDPHHLILGDRYEANAPLPEEVVRAALPYVDVISFQCFRGAAVVKEKLGRWARFVRKPILLADSATWRGNDPPATLGIRYRYQDPAGYRAIVDELRAIPESVGFHLCGAYIRNETRKCGLLSEDETPDAVAIQGIRQTNREVVEWVRSYEKGPR